MVLIVAYLKPFRVEAVLKALADAPILSATVHEVMGYGRQKHRLNRYLGSEFNASYLPKVEIRLHVKDEDAAAVTKTIVAHARTGRIGDGKILVVPCLDQHVVW